MCDRFATQGAFSWCELLTTDVVGAKKFYQQLLGWSMQDMPMENGAYTVLKAGEEEVGGIMTLPPPPPPGTPPHWGAYITVDNVDAVLKKAEELGGKILVPATDIPEVGRFAVLQDPQGAIFSIITYVKR